MPYGRPQEILSERARSPRSHQMQGVHLVSVSRNPATEAFENLQKRLDDAEERCRLLEAQLATHEALDESVRIRRLEIENTAHSFANMLTVVLAYVQQLPCPDVDATADALDAINHAKQLARCLIRREKVADPEPMSPAQLVRHFARIAQTVMGEDIRVILDIDEMAGDILAPPSAVVDVLLNLTLNARDAMTAGGALTLSVYAMDGDVVISVTDEGAGMTDETRSRMFEPEFTTKGRRGTGIGLTSLQLLFNEVDGHVEVDSRIGVGTTVALCFPRIRRLRPLRR